MNTPTHIAEIVSQILAQNTIFFSPEVVEFTILVIILFFKLKVSSSSKKKKKKKTWRRRQAVVHSLECRICSELITSSFMAWNECFGSSVQHPRSSTKEMLSIVNCFYILLDWRACLPVTSRHWKSRVYLNLGFGIIFIYQFHNNYLEFDDSK